MICIRMLHVLKEDFAVFRKRVLATAYMADHDFNTCTLLYWLHFVTKHWHDECWTKGLSGFRGHFSASASLAESASGNLTMPSGHSFLWKVRSAVGE